jgi:hypothetical protein
VGGIEGFCGNGFGISLKHHFKHREDFKPPHSKPTVNFGAGLRVWSLEFEASLKLED